MGKTLTYKILDAHKVSEDLENNKSDENNEISINNKEIKENHLSYKKDLWMYFESINSKFIKDRQKAKSLK